jgi:deoxyadenosine/deoxycytidine kinase
MDPGLYRYIAIEGNIGAGKTTLATLLAGYLGARLVLEEFADNNFLPKFYADPQRYAFPLEISFLADRYMQLKALAAAPDLFAQPVVTDYLLIKSRLFAKINLEPAEYDLFGRIFDVLDLQLPQPDVLIFLHAPVPTLQDHIRRRGRDYEQTIEDHYLERVSSMYDQYINTLAIPVIVVDTSAVNFSINEDQLKALLSLLSGRLGPKKYVLY